MSESLLIWILDDRETLEAYVTPDGELRVRAIKKGQEEGENNPDNPSSTKGNSSYIFSTIFKEWD